MGSPIRVLFLCTGNCCRSQMAEAILRELGGDRFRTYSAGTQPAGFVHPLATDAVRQLGFSTDDQYSKGLDELAGIPMDLIITVCDNAAEEVCPALPMATPNAHWGLPDPSFAPGTREDQLEMAIEVARQLQAWILALIALPLEQLSPEQRQEAARDIVSGH